MKKIIFTLIACLLLVITGLPAFASYGNKMDSWTVVPGSTTWQPIWWGNGSTGRIAAQLFTAGTNYYSTGVVVYLKRVGSPQNDYTIGIKAVSAGVPNGAYLASTTLEGNSLASGWEWVEYNFEEYAYLTSGTQYALTIEVSGGSPDENNSVGWRADNANPYAGGSVVYDTSPSSKWVTDTTIFGASDLLFEVWGVATDGRPQVTVYPATVWTSGATIPISAISTSDNITEYGLEWGLISGSDNYTDSWSVGISPTFSLNASAFIADSNLVFSEVYYYRAFADNGEIGYSEERSFIYDTRGITVMAYDPYYGQIAATDNFTGGFWFDVAPSEFSDNVTAHFGISPDNFNLDGYLTLTNVYAGIWQVSIDDWHKLYSGTWFYQAVAHVDGNDFESPINSFTIIRKTPEQMKYIPYVVISRVKDVSSLYPDSSTPALEITGRVIGTSDNVSDIFYYGFNISTGSDGNTLLPPVYNYVINTPFAPDNTFTVNLFLGLQSWYSTDKTVYFQAFAKNQAGIGTSDIQSYKWTGESVNPGSPSGTVGIINDTVAQVRGSLGLTGLMGTWAFMGLLLLLVALIFGTVMFTAKDSTSKNALAIIWALISISVVGAFIFTGELGIWPILILVGGVVVIVIIFTSVKLSGNSNNGGL